MKTLCKILALLLAVATFLSLFACGNGSGDGNDGTNGTDIPTEPSPSDHTCQSVCAVCRGCEDALCYMPSCAAKCLCALENYAAYAHFPVMEDELPVIRINTADKSNEWATKYDREAKLAGLIEYVDATVFTEGCAQEHILNGVSAEVKVRGNYTLGYPKKPIRIKFTEKTNLLGLHEGEQYKSWVLLADWKDLSMLNNTVAFYLGNAILGEDGFYCTDFRAVEVYLNDSYWGVYLLVEQQEAKDGRTSAPAVPKKYTGNDIGYLFEYDGYYDLEAALPDGDPTFTVDHLGVPSYAGGYTVKSDINAQSQLTFLQSYVNNVFYIAYRAVHDGVYYKFNADFSAVVPAPEYQSARDALGAVIDLDSLVDTYILNEIACDLDVDWSSFYLSLDMSEGGSKKITFEAPWDFDSSFGIISRKNCSNPEGLFAAEKQNPWFGLVVGEAWFSELVKEKWAEMKEDGVLEAAVLLVERAKTLYKESYTQNYKKWWQRLAEGNSEVVEILNTYKDAETAQGLAADYLKAWLAKRFAYLDSIWGQ